MRIEEALELIKSDSRIKKAVMLLVEEAILAQEGRLLSSSAEKPDEVIKARQQLEGARLVRASIVRSTGQLK